MAKAKPKAKRARKRNNLVEPATPRKPATSEEKIARLLGLLLVKDVHNNQDKVRLLRTAGFEVAEVADMLNMTPTRVSDADYKSKQKAAD